MRICGYLIANIIAFISVLHFADMVISWFFTLIRYPEVNFQFLLGLVFYPFAMITGISLRDCLLSSKLIGIKVSLNEVSVPMHSKEFLHSINSSSLIKNSGKSVDYAMN